MKIRELFSLRKIPNAKYIIGEEMSSEIWNGDFKFNYRDLTTLDNIPNINAPKVVTGNYYASHNKLTTLNGAPTNVGGNFECYNNKLTTLKGAPEDVAGFNCNDNQLSTLEYAPTTVRRFFVCSGNRLTTLKGAPSKVQDGPFDCSHNQLSSLEYCPKEVHGAFDAAHNMIGTLKDIHKHLRKMNGTFYIGGNPLVSNVLGILLVDGCDAIQMDNREVMAILNKYLPNKRGRAAIYDCQDELINAGFEEYAQL